MRFRIGTKTSTADISQFRFSPTGKESSRFCDCVYFAVAIEIMIASKRGQLCSENDGDEEDALLTAPPTDEVLSNETADQYRSDTKADVRETSRRLQVWPWIYCWRAN